MVVPESDRRASARDEVSSLSECQLGGLRLNLLCCRFDWLLQRCRFERWERSTSAAAFQHEDHLRLFRHARYCCRRSKCFREAEREPPLLQRDPRRSACESGGGCSGFCRTGEVKEKWIKELNSHTAAAIIDTALCCSLSLSDQPAMIAAFLFSPGSFFASAGLRRDEGQ
jgi:hypothetical protein